MSRMIRLLFTVMMVLSITQRLPAPIVEETTPTPAAEQSEAPKPKAKQSRTPDKNLKNSNEPKAQISNARRETQVEKNPFHGRWVGTVDLGIYGNVAFTLIVDSASTTVNETSSKFGTHSCAAQSDGKTLRWKGGQWFQGGIRSLTLNADGKTAMVTCSNGMLFKTTSVFVLTNR